MMIRTMLCQKCGIEGEVEVQGFSSRKSAVPLFRHLGHNPFSGHRHYECPACDIVDPMTKLGALISGHSEVDTIDAGVTEVGEQPYGKLSL